MEHAQPSGTVTFLFTDIEGSTVLLDRLGAEAYATELARHRELLRAAFARHGGIEVDTQGDAFFFAFQSASEAVAAAAEAQDALTEAPVRVRIGLHTGEALATDEGYVGLEVHRAARIAAAAHGGQVLLSRTTHDLVDRSVEVRDLGEHRLKDLSAPERLHQLGKDEFPPLRTLYRTNFPIPSTPFLGREHELQEVVDLLSRDDVRLVSLTGAGGTGKTRLAAQAAGVASGEYPDGVWWVPLATVREPALVVETARQALGAPAGLAEHIGSRSMLLLFDNFEQVVGAGSDVSTVLAGCPHLNVLVTSRERLHLAGEHEYPVPTLEHHEAVQLFMARATAAEASFEQSDAVAAICERVDNLPLAIELAAARVKALSPAQILERLDSRLPLLTGGARDLPHRQQTLRAAIEWSHDLLTDDERALFARLGIFAGGCTLEAAEDVAEAQLDTLQSLVEKSLLRHQVERYWMLETIREFAGEQLTQSGQRERVAASHARYYLALGELGERAFGTSDEAQWVDALARDHANLRLALACLSGSPLQLRLACALWRFWLHRADHAEGRRWMDAALAQREEAPPHDVAVGLRAAAVFARVRGDLDSAKQLTDESLAVARAGGERHDEMHAVGSLANIALLRGDYRQASDLMVEVEALAREIGDENAAAVTVGNRAYLALRMSEFELALELAREAAAISRHTGDLVNVVTASLNSALAAQELGLRRTAAEELEQGLEGARVLGHRSLLLDGLIIAAAIVVDDDPLAAARFLAAANRAREDLAIELDPIERDLCARVEARLPDGMVVAERERDTTENLDVMLATAASNALEMIAKLQQ